MRRSSSDARGAQRQPVASSRWEGPSLPADSSNQMFDVCTTISPQGSHHMNRPEGRQPAPHAEHAQPPLLLRSVVLFAIVIATALLLTAWKYGSARDASAAAANQPEQMEAVTRATATVRDHRANTTSIGTVNSIRSITLRNEIPGTVRY